jgi:hypothetical protein
MTTAIVVLLLVALIVFLSMAHSSSTFLDPPPVDRDQQRLEGDLRARRC